MRRIYSATRNANQRGHNAPRPAERNMITVLRFLALASVLAGGAAFGEDELEHIFAHPPQEAKPRVMWMWMGSNLTKQGITSDLEALHDAGFGGTLMFSLADTTSPWAREIGKSPTPEIVAWTNPWWEMVRHAVVESKRLGLDFGMFNGAGYESSGGPWITPELSMQELCWSETPVKGSAKLSTVLPRAKVDPRAVMPYPVFNPDTGKLEKPDIPARKTFFRDVAVLALPATGIVAKEKVLDLTDKMTSDGTLAWDVPAGQWIVYRFGYTTMGALIQPAQWKAIGLECDKMSPEAVTFHISRVIGEIKRHLGSLVGNGFSFVHLDSYEAGTPTWTPKMREEFRTRRGYDLTPYLATFAKRTIGSQQETKQFQAHFEATICDLYRDAYYATVSRMLREAGLVFSCEPYGGPWRFDDVVPQVHRVVTEFWVDAGRYSPFEVQPTIAALRKTSQNIVEAEAFTAQPASALWNEYPAGLKPIGDAAFCDGINRLVLHRFAAQPWADCYKPGNAMGQWGTHFDRTQTWWEPGKAMFRYWQRCQALLQWGRFDPDGSTIQTRIEQGALELKTIGRRKGSSRVFFVANVAPQSGKAVCEFPVADLQPELWDAVCGTRRELPQFTSHDGKTSVPLEFALCQSWFLVFRTPVTANRRSTNVANVSQSIPISEIGGSWDVAFDPKWGGPERVTFDKLEDWTNRPEAGIRYYSGTAVYRKQFELGVSHDMHRFFLDLGTVKHIARVQLNGRDLGVVWTAPWHVDITDAVRNGNNELEIDVTNVWANRLIGDEQEPPDCEWSAGDMGHGGPLRVFPEWFLKGQSRPSKERYCFTTWNYFMGNKTASLVPSGLLGPVRVMSSVTQSTTR